jgi:hypothetical protein
MTMKETRVTTIALGEHEHERSKCNNIMIAPNDHDHKRSMNNKNSDGAKQL